MSGLRKLKTEYEYVSIPSPTLTSVLIVRKRDDEAVWWPAHMAPEECFEVEVDSDKELRKAAQDWYVSSANTGGGCVDVLVAFHKHMLGLGRRSK